MRCCCDQMSFHIENREKIIVYDKLTRTYGIKVTETVRQKILFCPWCGEKLPSDLSKELESIIFDELDLDDFQDPRMPEEFKTDAWWKNRGL
jgi:hypothetical protein